MVPQTVARQTLHHESYRGADLFKTQFEATGADLIGIGDELASQHLTLDDVSMAVDGRSVLTDPPYFVNAMRFAGIPTSQLADRLGIPLGAFLVDDPTAGTFTTMSLGGKQVMRGTVAMIAQSIHERGLPYIYDVGDVRFVVITDSEAWAADALQQLP